MSDSQHSKLVNKELEDLEHAFKNWKIKNLVKNAYHLRYIRDD